MRVGPQPADQLGIRRTDGEARRAGEREAEGDVVGEPFERADQDAVVLAGLGELATQRMRTTPSGAHLRVAASGALATGKGR